MMRRHGRALPGAIETYIRLQAAGARQTVLTARRPHELRAVQRIARRYGWQPDDLVSCPGLLKAEYCQDNDFDLLIEDEPETLRRCHALGQTIASVRYRYNAQVIDELGIPHAASWAKLEPIIFGLVGLSL